MGEKEALENLLLTIDKITRYGGDNFNKGIYRSYKYWREIATTIRSLQGELDNYQQYHHPNDKYGLSHQIARAEKAGAEAKRLDKGWHEANGKILDKNFLLKKVEAERDELEAEREENRSEIIQLCGGMRERKEKIEELSDQVGVLVALSHDAAITLRTRMAQDPNWGKRADARLTAIDKALSNLPEAARKQVEQIEEWKAKAAKWDEFHSEREIIATGDKLQNIIDEMETVNRLAQELESAEAENTRLREALDKANESISQLMIETFEQYGGSSALYWRLKKIADTLDKSALNPKEES